jgi:ComF family protein
MGIAALLALVARPLDLLVPPSCAGCGLPGAAACDACLAGLTPLAPPWCSACGHPTPMRVARCPECAGGPAWARQAVAYAGPAPAMVAAFKDGRRRSLAGVLAAVMAGSLPRPPDGAVLVPVPLAPRRLAERGFNQSALIARALARTWDVPTVEALVRRRDDPPQRGAAARERTRQVSGAFAARPGLRPPRAAVLVDDVHTTGATLAACARALRRAGCREVGAVAFARALAGRAAPLATAAPVPWAA